VYILRSVKRKKNVQGGGAGQSGVHDYGFYDGSISSLGGLSLSERQIVAARSLHLSDSPVGWRIVRGTMSCCEQVSPSSPYAMLHVPT
jgi:hypothetical protein